MLGVEEIRSPGRLKALRLPVDPDDQQVVDVYSCVTRRYLPVNCATGGAQPLVVEQSATEMTARWEGIVALAAGVARIVHALTCAPARARGPAVRQFFRDNRNLGPASALVADTVYAALRRRRMLGHVTPGRTRARSRSRRW